MRGRSARAKAEKEDAGLRSRHVPNRPAPTSTRPPPPPTPLPPSGRGTRDEGRGTRDEGRERAVAPPARHTKRLPAAMAALNLCCNVIRSHDEWVASPVGGALAATPVCEIVKIADGPPVPFPAGDTEEQRPLSGVRVLDLSRVLAGPMCARTFAEHGADVLKVASSSLPDMRCVIL